MILGIVLVINGGLIFRGVLPRQQEVEVFSSEQKRPDYGEGDINEQVTVILSGEKNAKSTISIHIPEKEISQKEARDKVQEGMRYIQAYFENIKVKDNISLPTEWNEVTFYYESLSPDLLSNTGGWIGEIKEEPQLIELKVTAALAGQSLTEIMQLQTFMISVGFTWNPATVARALPWIWCCTFQTICLAGVPSHIMAMQFRLLRHV